MNVLVLNEPAIFIVAQDHTGPKFTFEGLTLQWLKITLFLSQTIFERTG